jgi:hypothetical protein
MPSTNRKRCEPRHRPKQGCSAPRGSLTAPDAALVVSTHVFSLLAVPDEDWRSPLRVSFVGVHAYKVRFAFVHFIHRSGEGGALGG